MDQEDQRVMPGTEGAKRCSAAFLVPPVYQISLTDGEEQHAGMGYVEGIFHAAYHTADRIKRSLGRRCME